MKKQHIKNLKLTRRIVSKVSELNETVGGGDSFGIERCMEDFTLGCSPTFELQCPGGTLMTDAAGCSAPPNCF